MVSTSKILTVSYGTFSCTLEGFDDSFDTMKAIAEYFRDLAADDRYFGAEPPQPDAEMLARIAAKETARRVEGRAEDGKIHLRASALVAPAALVAASVATPEAAPKAEAIQQAAQAPEIAPQLAADIAASQVDLDDNTDDLDLSAYMADALPAPTPVAAPAPERAYTPVPHSDQNSFASKLERIRAVVAREDEAEEEQSEAAYSEDEHAEDYAEDFDEETVAETITQDEELADDEGDDDGDELDDILDRLIEKTADKPAPTRLARDISAEVKANITPEPAAQPLRARVVKVKRSDFEAAIANGLIEEDDAEQSIQDTMTAAASSLSAEAEAELQRELAAVEAELTPRAAQVFEDDFDDEDFDDEDFDDQGETNSIFAEDDEDEDDYAYDDQDEFGDEFGDDEEEEDAIEAARAKALRPSRPQLPASGSEQDMTRLMAKAISEMDEPETTNRRNAIAHLRQAVQATKAEHETVGARKPQDEAVPYRDDLAAVVRPRRPSAGEGNTRRPEQRIAPLKLVAEQRIDAAPPAAPVRPRRVSMTEAAEQVQPQNNAPEMRKDHAKTQSIDSSIGFAEYAEAVGADALPDLLEAAAAYMSFVEGFDEFSRPQLMNKLRKLEGLEFSREDGLRTFGNLLREGKIERLAGGRFTVSDSIGFRPNARAAG